MNIRKGLGILGSLLLLSACNTVEGFGQDMSSVGQAFGNLWDNSLQGSHSQQRKMQMARPAPAHQAPQMDPVRRGVTSPAYHTPMPSAARNDYAMDLNPYNQVQPQTTPYYSSPQPPYPSNPSFAQRGYEGLQHSQATPPQYAPYGQMQPMASSLPYYYNEGY